MAVWDKIKILGSKAFSKAGAIGRQIKAAGANAPTIARVSKRHLRAAFLEESYLLAVDKSLLNLMKSVSPEVMAELKAEKQVLVGANSAAITVKNIQYLIAYLETDIAKIKRLIKLETKFTGLNAYNPKIVAEKNQIVNELHTLFADTNERIAEIEAKLEWLYKVTARLHLERKTLEAEHTQIYQYIRYARRTLDQYRGTLAQLNRLA